MSLNQINSKDIVYLFFETLNCLFKLDDNLLNNKQIRLKYGIYKDIELKSKYIFNIIYSNNSTYKFDLIQKIINYNEDNFDELTTLFKEFFLYFENNSNSNDSQSLEVKNSFEAIVKNKDKSNLILIVETYEGNEVEIKFDAHFQDDFAFISKNSKVKLLNFKYSKKLKQYSSTLSSYIILEPDYKVDVTDIANCFQSTNSNPKIYLLNKFEKMIVNDSLFFGSLVNLAFDKLLENKECDFDEIIEEGFKSRILNGIVIYKKFSWKNLKRKLKTHYENLSLFITDLEYNKVLLEPSFISSNFGIQGRLDALLWSKKEDETIYEIIELKSSKSPNLDYQVFDKNNESKGVWINHLIQVITYQILLEEFIKLNKGKSHILYSDDKEFPFRLVKDSLELRKEIIQIRNYIVGIDLALTKKNYSLLEKLSPNLIGAIPSYMGNKVINFNKTYKKLNELEKNYFQEAITFLSNLQIQLKTSNIDNKKQVNLISNLVLIKEESDFQNMYLKFQILTNESHSFRVGDYVNMIQNHQNDGLVHKAYIKEITRDYIVLSLRNKLTIEDFFTKKMKWKIVPEESDNLVKKVYPLLLNLFESENKEYLLGTKIPEYQITENYYNNILSENQNTIIKNAINADKYFLIQGPPGSGKTSRILNNLVSHYLSKEKKILVFAFTNRAVDHIESVLNENGITEYVRIGTKVNNSNNLLSNITDKFTFNEVINKLDNCSLYLSTISSLISNPEIFDLYDFDIAIVDEASQILELDLITILQKFKKFILIGDEKQLPAVCSLDIEKRLIDSKQLNEIGLYDFGDSLFSRLLKLNIQANSNNYGLLYEQARMDEKIMDIANSLFYNNKLVKMENEYNFIFQSKLYFINNNGSQLKSDDNEVNIINKIVEFLLSKNLSKSEIGIMSPFKLQCRNIKNSNEIYFSDEIIVDTIERFQGSEKEVIIISFATNYEYLIEQISSNIKIEGTLINRKLNVAITRAKKILILIGNNKVLECGNGYKKLIEYLKVNNAIIESNEFLANITQYLPESN